MIECLLPRPTRKQASQLDTHDLGRFLRAGWPIVLIGILIGAVLGTVYTISQQPEYEATARVVVGTRSTNDVDALVTGATFNQQIVATYTTVVTDPIVLDPVISSLGLRTTAADLADRVTASVPDGTLVIAITVTDSDAQRSAQTANAISDSLRDAVAEVTPGTGGTPPVTITTTREASTPDSPVSPNPPLDIVLGAMLGLILGLVVAFLRVVTDTRLRSARDVARITDAPVLGGIATAPRSERPAVLSEQSRHSARSESFRLLRTSLQFLNTARTSRSFVFTSPVAGEGKTTVVSGIASALAGTSESVVLVDADLRRPRVHAIFGMDGALGLTDLLIGAVTLDQVLQRWGDTSLMILPAGTVPPNPSELLQSARMVEVLAELAERFDTTLLDAPPVVPVADAAILAARTSGAILVIAEGRTRRDQVEKALARLAQTQGRLLGLVMNFERGNQQENYGYGHRPQRDKGRERAVKATSPDQLAR